jgi:hypothetical protein
MGNDLIPVSNGSGRVARDVMNCHEVFVPGKIPNKSGVENQENSPSFSQQPVIVWQKPCSAVASRPLSPFSTVL